MINDINIHKLPVGHRLSVFSVADIMDKRNKDDKMTNKIINTVLRDYSIARRLLPFVHVHLDYITILPIFFHMPVTNHACRRHRSRSDCIKCAVWSWTSTVGTLKNAFKMKIFTWASVDCIFNCWKGLVCYVWFRKSQKVLDAHKNMWIQSYMQFTRINFVMRLATCLKP